MAGKISAATVKRLVSRDSGARLNNDAADAIAAILESKAREIAEFAVARAKKNARSSVLKEDIEAYRIER